MLVKKSIDPKTLKNHPLNAEIYGTAPDADFVESVRKFGVLTPLIVTQTGTIISGHRRRQSAIMCELAEVPCNMFTEALDDLEIRKMLVVCNEQREKTTEQKAREYAVLKAVEQELAHLRTGGRPANDKTASKVDEVSGDANSGRADRRAAAQVGISAPTAEKAITVVKAIDRAAATGDTKRAEELRNKLNNSSVAEAHRAATASASQATHANEESPRDEAGQRDEAGKPIPTRLREVFEARDEFDAVLSKVKILSQVCLSLSTHAGGDRIRWNELKADIDNLRRHLRFARPHAVCPYCDGTDKKCPACKGTGWICEGTAKQAPKTEDSK